MTCSTYTPFQIQDEIKAKPKSHIFCSPQKWVITNFTLCYDNRTKLVIKFARKCEQRMKFLEKSALNLAHQGLVCFLYAVIMVPSLSRQFGHASVDNLSYLTKKKKTKNTNPSTNVSWLPLPPGGMITTNASRRNTLTLCWNCQFRAFRHVNGCQLLSWRQGELWASCLWGHWTTFP